MSRDCSPWLGQAGITCLPWDYQLGDHQECLPDHDQCKVIIQHRPQPGGTAERHQLGQGPGDPNLNLSPSLCVCLAPLLTGSARAHGWCLSRAQTLFVPDAKSWDREQLCIWQSCPVPSMLFSPGPLQPLPGYNPQSREPAGFRPGC